MYQGQSAASQVPSASRETQVSAAVTMLDNAVVDLQRVCDELVQRLVAVLRTDTLDKAEASTPQPIKVGLAAAIDERTQRIQGVYKRIMSVVNSLEI